MAWFYVILADLFEIAWPFVLKWAAPLSRLAPLLVVLICAVPANYLLAEAVKHLPAATVYFCKMGALAADGRCKTFDALSAPRQRIQALTMPGFGTTPGTRDNSRALMRQLGVTARETDIREMCLAEWRALGHRPFGIAGDWHEQRAGFAGA